MVTVQLVVLMPALFALMFAGVQAAMFYHGRTVAIAAAQEGARAAAAQNSSGVRGAAREGPGRVGVPSEESPRSRSRSATTATTVVTGSILSVIPGWTPTVTQSASAPVERLTR